MRTHRICVLALAACGPASSQTGGLDSIEVVPADATVVVDNGVTQPLDYTAIGHYRDGHTAKLSGVMFGLDAAAMNLGAMADATFTASGGAAGTGRVIAVLDALQGETTVNVAVHRTTGDGSNFGNPSPGAKSPIVDYPLDGAVMPSSVKAPDVQWEGPADPGDQFRVHIVGGLATVDTIITVAAGFKLDAMPSASDWQLLVDAAGGSPIAFEVDHWDAQTGAQSSAQVAARTISANLSGVIYYWNLSQGHMEQIDALGRTLAIASPPPSPTDGNHCIACHVVSRDGRYLAGALWDGNARGAVFDLGNPAVKMGNPAPTLNPISTSSYQSLFSSFNADATRLVVNFYSGLQILDPFTGAPVGQNGTPLPTTGAAQPTWSPDGTAIAFVNNIILNGQPSTWAVDYDHGNLVTVAVTGPDTYAPPQVVVASATGDPAFTAPSHPTFSPDSQWLAYSAGTYSRGQLNGTTYPTSLFVMPKAGGTPIRLDTACSGLRYCYMPNFSPFDQNGYFWLVFYSVRDYGNALAGTKGKLRRQMWITAIDKSKLGTTDASSVPYWLPDQDVQTDNMSGFWALPPPIQ